MIEYHVIAKRLLSDEAISVTLAEIAHCTGVQYKCPVKTSMPS